jgi:DNA-directed RNA polymerase specialized sigma24 family protein
MVWGVWTNLVVSDHEVVNYYAYDALARVRSADPDSPSRVVTRGARMSVAYFIFDGAEGLLTEKTVYRYEPSAREQPAAPPRVPSGPSEVVTKAQDQWLASSLSAYQKLGDVHAAWDVAQDSVVQLLLRDGPEPDSPVAYVVGVQQKLTLKELRRRARHPSSSLDAVDASVGSSHDRRLLRPDANDDRLLMDERVGIWGAVGTLTPKLRVAIVLIDMYGLNATEAGVLLGELPATLRQRLRQGRKKLSELLADFSD